LFLHCAAFGEIAVSVVTDLWNGRRSPTTSEKRLKRIAAELGIAP
jgi:hypothetical protein